jgi:hypothetical protein
LLVVVFVAVVVWGGVSAVAGTINYIRSEY